MLSAHLQLTSVRATQSSSGASTPLHPRGSASARMENPPVGGRISHLQPLRDARSAQRWQRFRPDRWAAGWATYLANRRKLHRLQTGPEVGITPTNRAHPSERQLLHSARGRVQATNGSIISPGSLGRALAPWAVDAPLCSSHSTVASRCYLRLMRYFLLKLQPHNQDK